MTNMPKFEPIQCKHGVYTVEMQERAWKCIQERRAREDTEFVLRQYMEAMQRAFIRRLGREHPERFPGLAPPDADETRARKSLASTPRKWAGGPRKKRKAESQEQFDERVRAHEREQTESHERGESVPPRFGELIVYVVSDIWAERAAAKSEQVIPETE